MADTQKMMQEYAHFYGKPLNNAEIERGFDQANERLSDGDFSNAVGLAGAGVEGGSCARGVQQPGVLYAELNDKSRAINAFREALARDMDYQAVRLNLDRMKDVMALGADPVSHEVESNNSATLANIIMPGKAGGRRNRGGGG